MVIFVFGNSDMPEDALPLKILPQLRERFPDIQFNAVDPNEEWDIPEEVVGIDTVMGIDAVQVFDNLERFVSAPRVTMHDFDALAQLRYLQKLGKIKKVAIIGVPPMISEDAALHDVIEMVKTLFDLK